MMATFPQQPRRERRQAAPGTAAAVMGGCSSSAARLMSCCLRAQLALGWAGAHSQTPAPAPPPPPVQMALQNLSGAPQALCLDGSPYKYYWRQGIGADAKKFLLAFRGGGWCTAEGCAPAPPGYDINSTTICSCVSRAHSDLGSSKGWADPLGDWDPHGMTSTNCEANPAFCRWSVAYLPYCDGTSFSSDRVSPVPTKSTVTPKLFFRGRPNLIAVLDDMLAQKSLGGAEAIVVSGHSAGGLATFLNADFIRSKLPAAASSTLHFFGAVPDGGFFLDAPNRAGVRAYGAAMRALFAIGNASGSLNARCIASRAGIANSSEYDCLFPQHHARFMQTPVRVTQSLYDAWQLPNVLALGCSPPAATCSAAQLADFQHYRNLTLAAMHGAGLLTPNAGGGAWADACIAHVQGYDGDFGDNPKYRVPGGTGVTVAESLAKWVASNANGVVTDAANYHVDALPWPLNKPCSGLKTDDTDRLEAEAEPPRTGGFEAEFHAVTQIGSSNYTGVDGHFWMPQPLFRAAVAMDSELLVSVAIHGDGAACPPLDRPHQACDEGLRQGPAAGAPWAVVPGGISPGNSLIRLNGSVTRGFAGLWLNTSTNTSGQAFFHDFDERGGYLRKGDATIAGMPPMLGIGYLQSTPSAVITAGPDKGLALTQFYGYLASAPATGGCKAAHPWEKPYCYTVITLASADGSGLSWRFRSAIEWDGERAKMPALVEGPCEPSLVVLPDGKTLLSVFRLQSNKNLWMSISRDARSTFGTAEETNAWAVFPQARTLGNGALALTAGRPGIGLWVTDVRGKIDPAGWRFYNLAAEHNKIVGDQALHFGSQEVAITNASSPTYSPVMTNAYTGLEEQGCQGDNCKLTASYDRVCNGNAGLPGPHGTKDYAFSLTFDVRPVAKTDDDGLVDDAKSDVSQLPKTLPWPMYGQSPTHCRERRAAPVIGPSAKRWQHQTGGWVYGQPAVGEDETIYFSS